MPETRRPLPFSDHSLAEIERALEERRLPPVDRWDPPSHGHSNMRIASDGSWFHEGEPITRAPLVRLFSSILRREPDGTHVLVTPGEKLAIDVDLAAFIATEIQSEGEGEARRIALRLNSEDVIFAGPDHPIRMRGGIPFISVRHGLEASLSRPVYYELAEIALNEGGEPPGVWSDGEFFNLMADA